MIGLVLVISWRQVDNQFHCTLFDGILALGILMWWDKGWGELPKRQWLSCQEWCCMGRYDFKDSPFLNVSSTWTVSCNKYDFSSWHKINIHPKEKCASKSNDHRGHWLLSKFQIKEKLNTSLSYSSLSKEVID